MDLLAIGHADARPLNGHGQLCTALGQQDVGQRDGLFSAVASAEIPYFIGLGQPSGIIVDGGVGYMLELLLKFGSKETVVYITKIKHELRYLESERVFK